jgi:aminopeptidase-like protein
LQFKVLEYETGQVHNGWTIPHKWEVKKALLKKDGKVIWDGLSHPLATIGYSDSFNGKIDFEELKKHIFYNEKHPDNIVYHCDFYYKPFLKTWGFSMPFNKFKQLEKGEYEVELETTYEKDTMKVLEYRHEGESSDTIVFNAHNCHAAQLNDGPAGYAVFMEVMKQLQKRKTKYSYQLVIAPEHIGTVFYLANNKEHDKFKQGIFMEMVGHDYPKFALQESFNGDAMIDVILHHVLKFNQQQGRESDYWSDKFRMIVGNDETVWEAPGFAVPFVSLSRCKTSEFFFDDYHLDSDNYNLIKDKKMSETFDIVMQIVEIFEKNCYMKRKFKGLIALSNPEYDLYISPGKDPSIKMTRDEERHKWNYLMDCIPRYFEENMTILDIAIKHDLYFMDVYNYVKKFVDKRLIEFTLSTNNARM